MQMNLLQRYLLTTIAMDNSPRQSAVMAEFGGTGNSVPVTAPETATQAETEGIPNLIFELVSVFLFISRSKTEK